MVIRVEKEAFDLDLQRDPVSNESNGLLNSGSADAFPEHFCIAQG